MVSTPVRPGKTYKCCTLTKKYTFFLSESKIPNNRQQSYGVLGTFPNPRPTPGRGFFIQCIYSYELSIPVMLKTPFYGPVGTLIA